MTVIEPLFVLDVLEYFVLAGSWKFQKNKIWKKIYKGIKLNSNYKNS